MIAPDVLAALRDCRMETATVASILRVPVATARRALRDAQAEGDVVAVDTESDGRYWRRGAARPLIWRATDAALARCKGGAA